MRCPTRDEKMFKHITVRCNTEDLKKLQAIVDGNGCENRSDAIRAAINFAYIFTRKKKEA